MIQRKNSTMYIVSLLLLTLCASIPAAVAVASFTPPQWASAFSHAAYERGAILDADNYVLYWGVNSDTKEIKFAAIVKTMGWVGLGISANGGMRGADIALLIQENGKLVLQDRWANATARPFMDAVQSKRLIEAETKQADGVTHFVFTRRWDACDTEDFPIEAGAVWVIHAFGESHNFIYHGTENRGSVRLNLLAPPEAFPDQSTTMEIDIVQPPYSLTSESTQYVCSTHILPNDKKYHVTIARPIVGMKQVHHMILFKCTAPHNQSTVANECSSMTGNCIVFWTGWAVGGQDMVYPPDAGLPMGVDRTDPNGGSIYMLLQIHYDNPSGLSGLQDQRSGFKLIYTEQLRKYDVGVLTLGDVEFSIPAQTTTYSVRNECPNSCTSKFPPSGITVIGNGFHMHELGKSAILQHIRDGTELPPIGHQKFYDFEHQNVDPTAQLTRVMPGDRLLLTCTWSSIGRATTTRFGEETSREMCFNFLAYYPKIDQFACFSLQPFWSGVLGVAPLDVAVCAPELNLGNLGSIQNTLAVINATSVRFDRSEPYTPLTENTADCTRNLPLCGNGQVDTGEDCERGDGCSACKCMQGWFPDRSNSICSSEPLKVDFLATSNGIATVASWAVAGVFLLILIFLAMALLLPKRRDPPPRRESATRSPKKEHNRQIQLDSDESDDSNARAPLTPVSPRKKNRPVRDAGSDEDNDPESADAGSMDEDADSIESSAQPVPIKKAGGKATSKQPSNKNKKQSSSSSSSSEEDEEVDDEDEDEDSEENSDEGSEASEGSEGSDDAGDDEDDSEASSSGGDDDESSADHEESSSVRKSSSSSSDEDDDEDDDESSS